MNVKTGDMAVIVSCDPDEVNRNDIGRFVTVLEPGDDWTMFGDSRHHWHCQAVDGQPLTAIDLSDPSATFFCKTCDIPDEHLRPIRPPGKAVTTTTEEELTC